MVVTPPRGRREDEVCWRRSSDGCFSTRTAYEMIYQHQTQIESSPCRAFWRWEIPERVKYFMWQISHERIPTNVVRVRHNTNVSNQCPFECRCEETLIHTLRDCEGARRVWSLLINPIYTYIYFFLLPCRIGWIGTQK